MKFGLTELFGKLRFYKGSTYVEVQPPASVPSNFTLTLPSALPGSTQALTVGSDGVIGYQALGGGGSVTSVALSLPDIFTVSGSPVTASGTLTGTLNSQTQNFVFAAPSGTNGTPTFRALAYADVSSFVGTSSNTLAAGNDTRFHSQGTDQGTTQTSFQIDTGNSGVRLKNNAGALQLRNSADSANADLIVANLTVTGTTTTVNSETITVDDNIIVLNNNVSSGSPTEDGGIQVRRGASTSASLIFDETNDVWEAGLAGSEIPLTRTYRQSFTNASLTSGTLAVTHGLGQQYVRVTVYDNSNKEIIADEVTVTSSTVATIDLSSYGTLIGTWNVVISG